MMSVKSLQCPKRFNNVHLIVLVSQCNYQFPFSGLKVDLSLGGIGTRTQREYLVSRFEASVCNKTPINYFALAPSAAPGDVQGHNTSSTSIQVSWVVPSAADQNGALTMYTVYYQAVSGNFNDGASKQKTVVAPLSEAVLTGLEEYVEYNISISASTSIGEGPLSASILVRTAEAGKTVSVEKSCVFLKTI